MPARRVCAQAGQVSEEIDLLDVDFKNSRHKTPRSTRLRTRGDAGVGANPARCRVREALAPAALGKEKAVRWLVQEKEKRTRWRALSS